jgi:hypothetical protein
MRKAEIGLAELSRKIHRTEIRAPYRLSSQGFFSHPFGVEYYDEGWSGKDMERNGHLEVQF